MMPVHERYVSARFDATAPRFRAEAAVDDYRLRACLSALGDVRGRTVLDLGCGKGRFARGLRRAGAEVIGLDASRGMLASAHDLDRVRGSASRLPFASRVFDGVVAIEVFEHLAPSALDGVFEEIRRVLRPGGTLAILDKNLLALDANRPWLPKLAVKKIDERRGRWMYPAKAPVKERWFFPGRFARRLRSVFAEVRVDHLLSPEEASHRLFRHIPRARLMTIWTARAAGDAS